MVGEGADLEVVHGQVRLGDAELGRRLAHLARQRVGREALRQRLASRSRTRRSGRRRPRRRAAPSCRRSRTRRRPCAARGRARASSPRSRLPPPRGADAGRRRGRARPSPSGPRTARCSTGCARRSRPTLARRRARARRLRRARRAGTRAGSRRPRSQAKSRKPGNAGLGRDGHGRRVRGRLLRRQADSACRAAYDSLKPPMPTPPSGWSSAIRIPPLTRLARLPAVGRGDECRPGEERSSAARRRQPTTPSTSDGRRDVATAAGRAPARSRRRRASPTISAAKLDCENEKNRPTQISDDHAGRRELRRAGRAGASTTHEAAEDRDTRKRP